MSEKIQNYWEERAKENYNKDTATTDDIHLRDLEIFTLIVTIRQIKSEKTCSILDLGCGDGRSTLEIASHFPECHFTGLDFSETMVKIANNNLALKNGLKERVNFIVGDVTKLHEIINDKKFDIIISDRCLINLDSSLNQYKTISDISNHLTSEGHFIAIENFIDGHNTMNDSRIAMGLPEIPIRWHNKYFYCDAEETHRSIDRPGGETPGPQHAGGDPELPLPGQRPDPEPGPRHQHDQRQRLEAGAPHPPGTAACHPAADGHLATIPVLFQRLPGAESFPAAMAAFGISWSSRFRPPRLCRPGFMAFSSS